jgi:hypothetical protein
MGSGEEPAASNESLETTCTDSPSLSPKSIVKENQFETGFIASARFEDQELQSDQPRLGISNSEQYSDINVSPVLPLNSDDGCGIDSWSHQIDRSVHDWEASESSMIPPLISLPFTTQADESDYLPSDTISHHI